MDAPLTRVPAEFVGKARTFRSRIEAADTIAIRVIQTTSRMLTDRMQRHPVPRPEILAAVSRAWRVVMPPTGRISQELTLDRKALCIVETRLCPQRYHVSAWEADAWEPGVAVVRLSLRIAPYTRLSLSIQNLCCASLHALGRRFERGCQRTDDAIIADLAALAAAHEALVEQPEGSSFDLPVADGRWLGSVLDVRTATGPQRMPVARTFVEG